jgi:hypothetical protein
MKKKLFLLALIISHTQEAYRSTIGTANESVEEAQQRFDCMSVRQIYELNMKELTPHQLEAFKKHAKKLFHAEVATPCCHSQADRLKYEVMYQKMGELHPALTKSSTI